MADEANEVTTEVDGEVAANSTESVVDWKKRYEDLRPQYDRIQNQYNQYEDPQYKEQKFKEWASEFGYEIEDTDTEVYDDPADQLRAEIAELKSNFQNYTQQQTQAQEVQIAHSYADRELEKLGVTDERVGTWIKSRATSMPAIQYEGHIVPDVQAAYEDYKELVNIEKQSWANSKQTSHVETGGRENTGVQTWQNESDPIKRSEMRQAWQIEQMQLRAAARES